MSLTRRIIWSKRQLTMKSLRKDNKDMEVREHLNELIKRYPKLECIQKQIWDTYLLMQQCYEQGGKILFAGNGGSCADAEHIVGELMKGFVKKRPLPDAFQQALCEIDPVKGKELSQALQGTLPAITLTGHSALATAFLNDVNGEMIYAQQTSGYGQEGDILFALSTSGNARNLEYAVIVAKAKGMKVIGLTGKDGGVLGRQADVAIIVPETETYKIQEFHLPVYHCLCLMLEEYFFDRKSLRS